MNQSAAHLETSIIFAAVSVMAALLILVAVGVAALRKPVRYLMASWRVIAEGR